LDDKLADLTAKLAVEQRKGEAAAAQALAAKEQLANLSSGAATAVAEAQSTAVARAKQ
jgi:hypothetical protein